MLYAICCMFHVIYCVLYVACYMLYVMQALFAYTCKDMRTAIAIPIMTCAHTHVDALAHVDVVVRACCVSVL